MEKQMKMLEHNMKLIKHKIAVMSGKGGVGKTTTAVNLAMGFEMMGYSTGILDADVTGPDVALMLGLEGRRIEQTGPFGMMPVMHPSGIRVMSLAFLLQTPDTPVIWRGPLKTTVIRQFLAEVYWDQLDFLVIDLPPGTADEPMSVGQLIPDLDGVVIVTTPQDVALLDVRKSIGMAGKMNVPILGIIENMSGLIFTCPDCGKVTEIDLFGKGGGEKVANELGIPFLGRIPLDVKIPQDSDKGTPYIVEHPDSPAAKSFKEVVKKLVTKLEDEK
jgi:Mrp family chromosome partitioning ATPase